jgi:hypothetical protein
MATLNLFRVFSLLCLRSRCLGLSAWYGTATASFSHRHHKNNNITMLYRPTTIDHNELTSHIIEWQPPLVFK